MAAILCVAVFLCSCNPTNGKKNKEKTSSLLQAKKSKIDVKLIGEVRTRRTFSNIQFMENQKEIDKYIARQEKSNPIVYDDFNARDSFLVSQFIRIGLIKNGEFLQKKYKQQTETETEFIDAAGRGALIKFINDQLTSHTHIKFFSGKDSLDIDTGADTLQDLDYAFLDIIRGGNKELVFLDDYYIMNGYNFDLKVYQVDIQ